MYNMHRLNGFHVVMISDLQASQLYLSSALGCCPAPPPKWQPITYITCQKVFKYHERKSTEVENNSRLTRGITSHLDGIEGTIRYVLKTATYCTVTRSFEMRTSKAPIHWNGEHKVFISPYHFEIHNND